MKVKAYNVFTPKDISRFDTTMTFVYAGHSISRSKNLKLHGLCVLVAVFNANKVVGDYLRRV